MAALDAKQARTAKIAGAIGMGVATLVLAGLAFSELMYRITCHNGIDCSVGAEGVPWLAGALVLLGAGLALVLWASVRGPRDGS